VPLIGLWTHLAAAKKLAEIGVAHILTSGQAASAFEGLPMLTQLRETFTGTIIVAGGINLGNAAQFKTHMLLKKYICQQLYRRKLSMRPK